MTKLSVGTLLTISFILGLYPLVFSQETLTITTYYPSPYGSYNELQLYPHSDPVTPCNANTRGTMFYDADDGLIKICEGSSGNWVAMGFWAASGIDIYNTNSGYVGIGTSLPQAPLDVQTSGPGVAYFSSSDGLAARIDLVNTSGSGRRYSFLSVTNTFPPAGPGFHIYDETAGSSRFYIDASGSVGIGTTNPVLGAKLEVNGAIRATGGDLIYECPAYANGCLNEYTTCVGQLQRASTCQYCVPGSGNFIADCNPVGRLVQQ